MIEGVFVSKKKFIFKILIFLALVIVIGGILLIKYSFKGWSDGTTSQRDEIINTNLGDEFKVNFETRNFPDIDTNITVMDSEGKEEITHFVIDGELNKTEFKAILNTSQIRCYQYYEQLIFKVDNSQFKGVSIERIPQMKPTEISEFDKVAKALVAKKEWIWVQNCGRYLLESGDKDMRNTIERYAKAQFTQEELDLNRNSKITKEQMVTFAKQILGQK
jgi:hypothetical protein